MVRFLRVLAALILTTAVAHAQSRDSQVRVDDNTYGVLDAGKLRVTPQGGSQTTLGAALAASGCTTNCNLSNPAISGGSIAGASVAATTLSVTTFQGWTPTLGAADSSSQTPATAGTGNAAGDSLTLNDGCSTHAVLGVLSVTSGGVTAYVVNNRGSCAAAPSNPVSVLSTTGSGTGATFNMTYGPLVAGLNYQALGLTGGNLFLSNGPAPGFYGTETTLVGGNAGNHMTGNSSFNAAFATGSCGGSSAGTGVFTGTSCYGVDAGRNLTGTITSVDLFGSGVLKTQSQSITTLAAYGSNTFFNLNVNAQPANLAGFGPGVCPGNTSVTPTFTIGSCFGTTMGANLKSLTQFLLLGNNVGNSVLTDGNGVILVGSGQSAVDAPTALVRHWMNIENSLIVTTILPTITSGFGTSPSVVASKGTSSAGFQINVGTGGTASSGVINVASHSNSNSNSPTGWICNGYDKTNSATAYPVFVSADDGQTVTVSNYSRTTNTLTAWAASDVLVASCNGY